jgi:hypothetical protein
VALASSQWRFTGFQPVHALEAHEHAIGKDADATRVAFIGLRAVRLAPMPDPRCQSVVGTPWRICGRMACKGAIGRFVPDLKAQICIDADNVTCVAAICCGDAADATRMMI